MLLYFVSMMHDVDDGDSENIWSLSNTPKRRTSQGKNRCVAGRRSINTASQSSRTYHRALRSCLMAFSNRYSRWILPFAGAAAGTRERAARESLASARCLLVRAKRRQSKIISTPDWSAR